MLDKQNRKGGDGDDCHRPLRLIEDMKGIKQMKDRINDIRNLILKLKMIGDEGTEYRGAVCKVDTYMKSLDDMFLPAKTDFNNTPDVYEQIKACYQTIGTLTSKYTIDIHSNLQTYPSNTQRALENISSSLSSAKVEIENILGTISSDFDQNRFEQELDNLAYYLESIINIVNQQIQLLTYLIGDLEEFSKMDVLTIKKNMNDILSGIGEGSKDFEYAKELLLNTQNELENEISSQINNIIADGAGIFLGIVIAALTIAITVTSGGTALPITLSTIVGIGTIAATCVPIIMDSIELKSLQAELEKTVNKIDSYEQDILLFTQWEAAVEKVNDGLQGMIKQFKVINQSWTDVRNGFDFILSEVQKSKDTASTELTVDDWKEIDETLTTCQKVCQETSERVTNLSLAEISVSDASIEINMTEEEIKSALASSKVVSFTEYMLSA